MTVAFAYNSNTRVLEVGQRSRVLEGLQSWEGNYNRAFRLRNYSILHLVMQECHLHQLNGKASVMMDGTICNGKLIGARDFVGGERGRRLITKDMGLTQPVPLWGTL